ncbi:MAG: citrate (Si)-synthase [Simkaniaceae bacterium]|nr:citrate (Si)-synthase [Candidatus Sacchlamyda saccharinae]
MTKPLFTITEENLDTGMRGYPIGYCDTSHVDPDQGLFYCGRSIREMALKSPEEVIYLLYHRKEGSVGDVESFFSEINTQRYLSKKVAWQIKQLPREAHPMKLFSIALLFLDVFEKTGDYRKDCLNVIAQLPHLVASVINHHAGWGETKDPSGSYMGSFADMLNVPGKNLGLEKALSLFNVLHYDHGGGNLSVFVGKAVASGLEGLYGSLSSAMCALSGPRHGSANQVTLEFVKELHQALGDDASLEMVEDWLQDRLKRGKLIFGFGHAVLRTEDPRASILYDFVQKYYSDHPLARIALLLKEAGPKVLKENPKVADPYPNVDAISGTMLTAAGLGYPEYFTLLFGMARCVGVAIQIVYERLEAREGKGTPIIRPKYLQKMPSSRIL